MVDRTRKCGKVYIGQNQRCRESAKRRKRERVCVCVSECERACVWDRLTD